MPVCARCAGIFVDLNNNLYCSTHYQHQVVSQSLTDPSSPLTIAAGTGCSGSASNMLDEPFGIFVTTSLDLYVADSRNDRIQLFRRGETNGTTVAGNRSSGTTFPLRRPTGVVLDADGYLFIVDSGNNRIVGSGPEWISMCGRLFGIEWFSIQSIICPSHVEFRQ